MSNIKARNCVCIHIGQAGLQIGQSLWELLCAEHGINPDGTKREDSNDDTSFKTFFQETPNGQYVPRTLFVDLEPTVMDEIRTGSYKQLFHPELMINGMEDTGSNFARGRITLGQHIMPILTEKIRFITEACDTVQGFFIFNSYGGGTGSGLGSFIAEKLAHEFSRRTRLSVAVYPGKRLGSSCVEPFNSLFFAQSVVKDIDISLTMDNDSLYDVCARNLCFHYPTFVNTNRIMSQVISSLTCNIRFVGDLSGTISGTLEELRVNLIPYPSMSFPVTSFAPIMNADRLSHQQLDSEQLIKCAFEKDHRLITSNLEKYAFMASVMYYRGNFSPTEINMAIRNIKEQKQFKWVDWCPTGFKIGINRQPPTLVPGSYIGDHTRSVLLLANSGSIAATLKRLKIHTRRMLQKRAFFHWYEREGLEFDDIREAIEDITVVEMDYREATKLPTPEEIAARKEEQEEEERRRKEQEDQEAESPRPIPVVRRVNKPRPSIKPGDYALTQMIQQQKIAKQEEQERETNASENASTNSQPDIPAVMPPIHVESEVKPHVPEKPEEVEKQTDNSAEIVQKVPAKVIYLNEYHLIDGDVNCLCKRCQQRVNHDKNLVHYTKEGKLPISLLCKYCLEGAILKNKKDICGSCKALVTESYAKNSQYKEVRLSQICPDDASKFKYTALRTNKNIRSIVTQPMVRVGDICTACKDFVTNDDEEIYVSGSIYIDALCDKCERNNKRELEVYARKAILASDLCDRCKGQVHSVQPKLCKVWGAIESSHMCPDCVENYEVDPDNNMIDPGSLCDNCRLRIDAITPTALPVKGSITSEKVCNDCKRRGRLTSREVYLEPSKLCYNCKKEIRNDIPKVYQGKGSFDLNDLCSDCRTKVPKKNKVNLDELCLDCKVMITGKGHEINVRGHIDARQICNTCLENVKKKVDGGNNSIHMDQLCHECKQHMRGKREEIVVRGGISSTRLCDKCKPIIKQPIRQQMIDQLCDDCLDTIPKAGGVDKRNMCGNCTKFVTTSMSNSNWISDVSELKSKFNSNVSSKKHFVKSAFKFRKHKCSFEAGDSGKPQNVTNDSFRRQLLTIIDRVTRCRECSFEGGLSVMDGYLKGGPSNFCDDCLIKLGLPNEFLVLCQSCRQDKKISFSTFDLHSRPLSNTCISCKNELIINYHNLQSLMIEYRHNHDNVINRNVPYFGSLVAGSPCAMINNQNAKISLENQTVSDDEGEGETNWISIDNDGDSQDINTTKSSKSFITFIKKKLDFGKQSSSNKKETKIQYSVSNNGES